MPTAASTPPRRRPRGPRPLNNRLLPHVMRYLRAEHAKSDAPVVTFIATVTRDPYRVLTSCILSLRTQDQVTVKAAERLFELAPDVETLAEADVAAVAKAIYPVGFYKTKAPQLVAMSRRIVAEFGGKVPDDLDTLLTLKGVGRKTANLVVTAAYGKPGICVDTHVHRIANLWGYVDTKTPEETEMVLREKLPRRYWHEINDVLVSFGQTRCRPQSPICSSCGLASWCPRIGVGRSR